MRFVLEMAALVVLGVWGWRISFVLGIALPLAAALVWGSFVAPKARWYLPLPGRLAIEALIFGGATAALIDMGAIWGAVVLAVLAVGIPLWYISLATANVLDCWHDCRVGDTVSP